MYSLQKKGLESSDNDRISLKTIEFEQHPVPRIIAAPSRWKFRDRGFLAYGCAMAYCLSFGAGTGSAFAQSSVSIRSVASERLIVDDNYRLTPESDGWVYGSMTAVGVEVETRAPLDKFRVDFDGDFNRFIGPGAGSDINSFDWIAGLGYDRTLPRGGLTSRAEYRQQAVSRSEVDDSGATTGGGDRITKFITVGGNYDFTSVDSGATNAQFSDVTFRDNTNANNNPYRSASLSGEWARRFTPRDTGTATVSGTYFEADNAANTTSQAFTLDGLYERRESPRLTIWTGAGIGAGIETSGSGATEDTSISAIFNLDTRVTYTLERVTLSASLFQGVQPSASGSLQQRRTARVNLNYRLTSSVRLNLSATHTDSYDKFEALPLDGAERRYSVGETELAWRFLANWDLATAYRFRRDDDTDGTANSHAVFATLTYRTTLLP